MGLFRALFIGVNKHADPGVHELTGAVRDAQGLHALFQDTFTDLDSQLLLDAQATIGEIRAGLKRVLDQATENDVVVISFAGHGTKAHQIVAYDTDREDVGSTTLPMDELSKKFRESKARAILCIVDCCFSGAMPARVLEGTPIPRADFDFSSFRGKGRFLLAASSPTQPAWEEPGTGHGLLTGSIIQVLTAGPGPIDIPAAVADIAAATRNKAAAIGEVQDPCFVGGIEGKLELPVLKKGETWQRLFPDRRDIHVGTALSDLAKLGVPQEVIALWESRYPSGLNELQKTAVNTCRVLNGDSLLAVAPTSSGKTFIGELAAVKAAVAGRKSVFLLPYRALVNEKYEDFAALYGDAGLRVIRCSGDFTDETGLLLSGRYDIAFLTYEMFLSLGVSSPHILRALGLVVLDEGQFITDPGRGISVELLLTLLLASRSRGVAPQLIVLSAVIGAINSFDEWLGTKLLIWTKRPVPLTEGVLDRHGVFQYVDETGAEAEVQLLPQHAIRMRTSKASAQDVIVPLVSQLMQNKAKKEKILIFRNTRGPTEGCAAYIARDVRFPAASSALSSLSPHDLSGSGQKLRECLSGGTAFHNSNLRREERLVVERGFRATDGGIEVLAATTTLAAGINTPASTVILAEQEFIGEDGRPFTVAEYKNMAGRAGRLGYNESGKAIILAETPFQRRHLFERYVRGPLEPIASSFGDHDTRTWVIRLLSQVKRIPEANVAELLISTYGGFLASKADPGWKDRTGQSIAELVAQFVELGLLERNEGIVQLTLLGRACGESSLSFDSSMRLIEALRLIPASEIDAYRFVGLVQLLPEADKQYTPVRKKARIESVRIEQARAAFGSTVVGSLRRWADEIEFWGRCKRAAILADWMQGSAIQDIEQKFSVPFGGQIQAGDISRFADSTRFHLRSAHQILSALLGMTAEHEAAFEGIALRLEFGAPVELVPLMKARLGLTRGEALALSSYGLQSLEALADANVEVLSQTLGVQRGKAVFEKLAKL